MMDHFLWWRQWIYHTCLMEEQNVVSQLAEQGRIKLDGKTARAIKDMEGEVTAEQGNGVCRHRNAEEGGYWQKYKTVGRCV